MNVKGFEERLQRATEQHFSIEPQGRGYYQVINWDSKSDGGGVYTVRANGRPLSCSCPDFQQWIIGRTHGVRYPACKHMLAVQIWKYYQQLYYEAKMESKGLAYDKETEELAELYEAQMSSRRLVADPKTAKELTRQQVHVSVLEQDAETSELSELWS